MTKDMDLAVHLRPQDVSVIERMFPLEEFYSPPPEELPKRLEHMRTWCLNQKRLYADLLRRGSRAHAA